MVFVFALLMLEGRWGLTGSDDDINNLLLRLEQVETMASGKFNNII